MKKLITLILVLFSSFVFAQEYDDMYFNRKDRKRVTVVYESNRKHINPEYIARYTTKPVKVTVQSYHKPYRNYYWTSYNNWYSPYYYDYYDPFYTWYPYGYNYYSWYPYRYDPFFMRHNYYSWYGGWHRPYYAWNYHYGHNYGYYNHYGYNNYGHINSYHTKTYVTTHKNEVNRNVYYQPRRTRNTNYNTTSKTNYNNRTVDYSKIRKPVQTRLNKNTRGSRISTYTNRPTRNQKSNSGRSMQYRSNYKQSNSYQNRSTKSSSYSAPSRSRSSYSAPSRSSGSSSGSRSGSSGSRGRRQ